MVLRVLQAHGNEELTNALKLPKNRKFYIRKAVETYSKGIAANCSDKALVSVLYANRAQAQLKLENYRAALHDSLKAISYDSSNIKVKRIPSIAYIFPAAPALKRRHEIERSAKNMVPRGSVLPYELGICALFCSKVEAGALRLGRLTTVGPKQRSSSRN